MAGLRRVPRRTRRPRNCQSRRHPRLQAGTSYIVDPTVVTMAASLGAIIWTSDPNEIRTVIDAQDIQPAPVLRIV